MNLLNTCIIPVLIPSTEWELCGLCARDGGTPVKYQNANNNNIFCSLYYTHIISY